MMAPLRICRAATRSGLAWLVVALHASIYVLCIANMAPPDRAFADSLDRLHAAGVGSTTAFFAGRPFHFTYESAALQVITVVDLPAAIVAAAAEWAVQSALHVRPSVYTRSWLDAGAELFFASVQWLLLGYWLERRLVSQPRWTPALAALDARRALILFVILAATVLAAPLIQMRSNALGFRHPGTSFGPTR